MIGAQIMRALRRAGDLCARYDDSTFVAAAVGQDAERESAAGREDRGQRARSSGCTTARKVAPLVTTRARLGFPPGATTIPSP